MAIERQKCQLQRRKIVFIRPNMSIQIIPRHKIYIIREIVDCHYEPQKDNQFVSKAGDAKSYQKRMTSRPCGCCRQILFGRRREYNV